MIDFIMIQHDILIYNYTLVKRGRAPETHPGAPTPRLLAHPARASRRAAWVIVIMIIIIILSYYYHYCYQ